MGTGTFDYGCFPGNIMLWLIDLDHNLTLAFRYYNFYSPIYQWIGYLNTNTTWPGSASAGHGKRPPKRFEGSEGLNNYVLNYLQPHADVFFGGIVDFVGKLGQQNGKGTTVMEATWGDAVIPQEE